jgi:hypothetical protein
VSNTLLAVLIVVSLVPSATIGALLWQGVIRTPWSTYAVGGNDASPPETEKALTTRLPAETVQLKQDVEDLSVTLTAPTTIEAEGDKEVPFRIRLNSANPLPFRSTVTIGGLPEGTTLSYGRPYGETEWTLRPDEIGDLHLLLPKAASGQANLRIALVAADGTIIASAATQLNIAGDHKTALIARPDETGRIADLIAHGQKMIEVGYLPGARGYFQRAAEAGSADAAYALGTTYDRGNSVHKRLKKSSRNWNRLSRWLPSGHRGRMSRRPVTPANKRNFSDVGSWHKADQLGTGRRCAWNLL